MNRRNFLRNAAGIFVPALLIPAPVLAQDRVLFSGGKYKRVAEAAAPGGYLFQENFEGTGYELGGSWAESGTGTIDEDYTGLVLEGSQSLRLNQVAQTGRVVLSGLNHAAIYGYMLFRHVGGAFPTNYNFLGFRDSTPNTVGNFRCNSGTTFRFFARDASTNGTQSTNGPATDTTYHCWFSYIAGTGANAVATMEFSTDGLRSGGGLLYSSILTGPSTTNAASMWIGVNVGGSTTTCQIIVDKIRLSATQIGDNPT